MRVSVREKVLDAASRLFYENGIHATGVDRVVAESGVTKMTLYKHFVSKQELVLATLRLRDENWRNWFQATVESLSTSPEGRLLAMFDALELWFSEVDFRGCPFLKAAAEFCETDHAIHQQAAEHFHRVRSYIETLVVAAEPLDASGLADGLNLLVMGAIAAANSVDDKVAASRGRKAATALLAAHGIALPA